MSFMKHFLHPPPNDLSHGGRFYVNRTIEKPLVTEKRKKLTRLITLFPKTISLVFFSRL